MSFVPEILYEDNHLLVVVKPKGVLSQPGKLSLPDMLTELKGYLVKSKNKPGEAFLGLVHRLDTNVSGVMVFAKTSKAASRLSRQIREHAFEKTYLAVVDGQMPLGQEKRLESQLAKDPITRTGRTDPDGKPAVLDYKVLAVDRNSDSSLLTIRLGTGRFHQIRLQLAEAGHPLVGDSKYGQGKEGLDNLGLFAYKLVFVHPTTLTKMVFRKIPDEAEFKPFTEAIKTIETTEKNPEEGSADHGKN